MYNETNNGTSSSGSGVAEKGGPHRFQPGCAPGPGRPKKAVERAYLDALREALPPDQLQALIVEALELARSTRSWRGMLEIINLAMSYGAGKPVSKVVQSDGNLEALLAALADDTTPLLPSATPAPSLPR